MGMDWRHSVSGVYPGGGGGGVQRVRLKYLS